MSFDQPTIWIIILAVVIAAVVLDVVLVRLSRRLWTNGRASESSAQPAAERRVYVMGAFSPILTLLRYGRLPRPAPVAAEAVAQPQGQPRVAPPRPALRPREWPGQLQGWLRRVLHPANLRRAWSGVLLRPGESAPTIGAVVSARSLLIEWSLIAVIVLVYCTGFLQFTPDRILTGNEAQVFQIDSWVLTRGLQSGTFPLWNPYMRSGIPFISDPMLHIFNPLTSLPVLVFGVLNGYKIALFLSFLAAAWGMWFLGRVAGLAAPARLWVAFMYAFAGQPVAKFLQGHYLFVFGFAWIPWALAGLLLAIYTRRRRHVALAVVSLALIFLSGNAYYAFYTLLAGLVLTPVLVLVRRPRWHIDWRRVQVLAVVAVLALGLIALQLLPLAEFWPRINKASNPNLTDSQTFEQVVLDLTSTDHNRPDARDALPPEEYYAYSGWWPILALVLLPLAVWKRKHRRTIVMGVVLLVLALIWIDTRDMPWRQLYVAIPLLVQFRYPTRMLIFAALALILLAGLALDTLWRYAWPPVRPLVRRLLNQPAPVTAAAGPVAPVAPRRAPLLASLAVVALTGFLVWSAFDVFQVNSQLAVLQDNPTVPQQVASWLAANDQSAFYLSDFTNWHEAYLTHGIHYLNAWLYYDEIRTHDNQINKRQVEARPKYWVLGSDRNPADMEGSLSLVQTFDDGYSLYQVAGSLPYAFTVSQDALTVEDAGELTAADVTALTPYTPNPNRMEVIAQGQGDQKLVMLVTHFPGWHVTVDGRPADLLNVGGYLATTALPGAHDYVFTFQPLSFDIGLVISLLALAVLVYFVATDWPFRWAAVVGALRGVRLPAWRPNFGTRSTGAGWTFNVLGFRVQVARENVQPMVLAAGGLAFAIGLLVYAFTRLYALDKFPIYFFADETVGPELAKQLLERGFKDATGQWLPIYFDAAAGRWTPLLSVYVHAITVFLFGKTLIVTRATSALVSLGGAAAISLILRKVFNLRFWWMGVLVLGLMPAWFLHSRTAFETVMMCSFYAYFLLFYMLYRLKSPRYIYPALIFGALAFYTYSNGQSLVGVTAALLLLSDLRYHWQQRATLAWVLLLGVVVALPLLLFQVQHGGAFGETLRTIDSYLYQDIPLLDKIKLIGGTYLYALSPQYLFFPNGQDLSRHIMRGYAHLRTELFPFVLIGLALCLRYWRSPAHRTLIVATLAAPVGAALVGVGITRVLSLAIPGSLFACLGLDLLLSWGAGRLEKLRSVGRAGPAALGALTLIVLVSANLALLRDALVNGPTWDTDYGLYGMQYGAKQLFADTIPVELAQDPNVRIVVSSIWANAADSFIRFFLTPDQQARVTMGGLDAYQFSQLDVNDVLLVLTPAEYDKAVAEPKFKAVDVQRIVPYPTGDPGFYFVRLTYADNVAEVFAAEEAARRQPVDEPAQVDGEDITVRHSVLSAGNAQNLFDHDVFTLIRGLEANPLLIELLYPAPKSLAGVTLDLGSMDDFNVTVTLTPADGSAPLSFTERYTGLINDPHLELDFAAELGAAPPPVTSMRIEIKNLLVADGDSAQTHVREVTPR